MEVGELGEGLKDYSTRTVMYVGKMEYCTILKNITGWCGMREANV